VAVDASIVIPTVGRPDLLALVLRALERQAGSFEVVVVCDGEHAQTRRMSETWHSLFPLKWVFCPENRGFPEARNIGAGHARGSVILFLDDDSVPAPGWVAAHAGHHAGDRNLVVAGRLENSYSKPPGSGLESFMREFTDRVEANLQSALGRMDADADRYLWVGLNTSVTASVFRLSGGFDPALRYVQEDAELAARVAAMGAEFVYEPDALVCHHGTKDLAQLHLSRAALCAQADIYRLRQKRQAAAKWPAMAALYDSKGAQKLKNRLAWHLPRLSAAMGELCRIGGEALGAEFLFRQWCDLAFMTRYWGQVKALGLSADDVRRLTEI
jgi:GT2 family glycosyltransferase